MALPVRWSVLLSVTENSHHHDPRTVELAPGELVPFGGPGGPAQEEAPPGTGRVTEQGTFEVTVQAGGATVDDAPLSGTTGVLAPGQRLAFGSSAVRLLVPPHLISGRAPKSLARWKLAFELQIPTRTQPFTLTRSTGEVFSVGRQDQNALRLPTDSLARRHAEFFVDADGQLWVRDCASSSGTWRGTTRLDGWNPVAVGEAIRAGGVTVLLTARERLSE